MKPSRNTPETFMIVTAILGAPPRFDDAAASEAALRLAEVTPRWRASAAAVTTGTIH